MTAEVSAPGWSRLVLAVLATVLVVRMAVFLWIFDTAPKRMLHGDTERYIAQGVNLAEHGRFAQSIDGALVPETFRAPLYGLLTAASLVVGKRGVGGVAPLMVLQIVISVATITLVYLIVRRLHNAWAGGAAVVVYALDLSSYYYAEVLLPHTIFIFFLTCGLYAGARLFQAAPRNHLRWALLAGGGFALAIFTRQQGYLLAFLVPLGIVACTPLLRWTWRQGATVALATFLPSLLLIGGWQVRNYVVAGQAAYATAGASNLYSRKALPVYMIATRGYGRTLRHWKDMEPEALAEMNAALPGDLDTMAPSDRPAVMMRRTVAIVVAHPMATLQLASIGFMRMFAVPGEVRPLSLLGLVELDIQESGFVGDLMRLPMNDYLRTHLGPDKRLSFVVGSLYLLVLLTAYLSACVGLWMVMSAPDRGSRVAGLLVLGVFLYLAASGAGLDGSDRHRTVTMPDIAIFAGVGLSVVVGRRRRDAMVTERPGGMTSHAGTA